MCKPYGRNDLNRYLQDQLTSLIPPTSTPFPTAQDYTRRSQLRLEGVGSMSRRFGYFCRFLLALAPPGFAQLTTTSSHGIVRDPSGAVIPNATVKLVDSGARAQRNTTAGADDQARHRPVSLHRGRAVPKRGSEREFETLVHCSPSWRDWWRRGELGYRRVLIARNLLIAHSARCCKNHRMARPIHVEFTLQCKAKSSGAQGEPLLRVARDIGPRYLETSLVRDRRAGLPPPCRGQDQAL
jgi:hypothetical protein